MLVIDPKSCLCYSQTISKLIAVSYPKSHLIYCLNVRDPCYNLKLSNGQEKTGLTFFHSSEVHSFSHNFKANTSLSLLASVYESMY